MLKESQTSGLNLDTQRKSHEDNKDVRKSHESIESLDMVADSPNDQVNLGEGKKTPTIGGALNHTIDSNKETYIGLKTQN